MAESGAADGLSLPELRRRSQSLRRFKFNRRAALTTQALHDRPPDVPK